MKLQERLHGSITALATPFKGGQIDEKAFEKLVEWQIAEGSHGLVVCGTTGESPTLSNAEQDRLIRVAVQTARGRVPVIAGTGSNNTHHTINRTTSAEELGADAALIVTPYYNKPVQEGLFQHFKAVHDATRIPIILYNIPSRCVVDILPVTMKKLAALERVIGVKDAAGDLSRPVKTRQDCGPDFIQFAGDDALAGAFLAQGARGCISVASNVAPRLSAQVQNAWAAGDRPGFEKARDDLAPLIAALFVETSPSPVKYALNLLGMCSEEMRLPLITCQQTTKDQVMAAMDKLGLLKARAA